MFPGGTPGAFNPRLVILLLSRIDQGDDLRIRSRIQRHMRESERGIDFCFMTTIHHATNVSNSREIPVNSLLMAIYGCNLCTADLVPR